MNMQCLKWPARLVPLFLVGALVAAPFEPLFRVMTPKGPCQVRKPGAEAFEAALKGKAYPYGTLVRCGAGASALIVLSDKDAVQIGADTTVEIANAPQNEADKVVRLLNGQIVTRLDPQNASRALTVETPVASCVSLTGNAKFKFAATATGYVFDVQAESGGTVKIIGPQFIIPQLKNGYGARMATASDSSLTRIDNLLGDYSILINKGAVEDVPDLADGEVNEDLLAVETSTRSSVKIWRTRAPVGGRLIVSVLATDSNGKGTETFAFAVGQPSIASRAVFEDADATATNPPAIPEALPEAPEPKIDDPFAAPAPAEVEAFM